VTIAENLSAVRARLARVAPGKKMEIMAVAKYQPLERLREAIAAGVTLFGQNYAQEGEETRAALSTEMIHWHFIGHIQSRKVKFLVNYDCVQSLDRLDVAEMLNARLAGLGKTLPVLVEVNVGGETQKSGIAPDDLGEFLKKLSSFNHLVPRGLMAMPPPLQPVEERRPYFRQMSELFASYSKTYAFQTLSMGTSEDFEVAASEGSTLIRLGTILLGHRDQN
jgi:PLP dependent protein